MKIETGEGSTVFTTGADDVPLVRGQQDLNEGDHRLSRIIITSGLPRPDFGPTELDRSKPMLTAISANGPSTLMADGGGLDAGQRTLEMQERARQLRSWLLQQSSPRKDLSVYVVPLWGLSVAAIVAGAVYLIASVPDYRWLLWIPIALAAAATISVLSDLAHQAAWKLAEQRAGIVVKRETHSELHRSRTGTRRQVKVGAVLAVIGAAVGALVTYLTTR